MDQALLQRARSAWARLAGDCDGFEPGRTHVIVQSRSRIAPEGWVGIVSLGDAAVAVVPSEEIASRLAASTSEVAPELLPTVDWTRCGAARVLGPAALFFAGNNVGSGSDVDVVTSFPPDDPLVAELVSRVSSEDAGEAAIEEVTSPLFALVVAGRVMAASGYRLWPEGLAHVSVLTAAEQRRSGYGRLVATAAIADAAKAGHLPQWRARPVASQMLARALGLTELGAQVSFNLAAE